MRILLVEDDQKIASFIIKGLKAEGFAVDHAADGRTGLDFAMTEPYDTAIVDIMLPGLDGLSIIRTLRASDNRTPALILSALGEVDDRVDARLDQVRFGFLIQPVRGRPARRSRARARHGR